MRTSEQTDKIDAVIALVQAMIEPVKKNKTVEVEGKTGPGWSSGYATLAALDAAVRPALKQHGVAVYQGGDFVQGLGAVLSTRLAHAGQWVESYYPVKTSRDGAQGFGGGISFARRWGLCGMLNLVPDDIEEGQGYKDAKAANKTPRKQGAPGGLGAFLDSIRDAETCEDFTTAAARARASHPTGEASASVEKTIETWFIAACDRAETLDTLTSIRDTANRVKPRGSDVRSAIQRAGVRLEPR